MTDAIDPHALSEEDFHAEVHSFQFWLEAVEGYLAGTEFGFDAGQTDETFTLPELSDLITTLCNYCVAEKTALEASSGMIRFAPSPDAAIFLSTQVADEGRHLEVFVHRLKMLGIEDPWQEIDNRANRSLLQFKDRLLEFVDQQDWEAAIFVQNVLLEAMEFTVFKAHASSADPITSAILAGVVKDERRHMGFGENDLGRKLRQAPHTRTRLNQINKELNPLVLSTFSEIAKELKLNTHQGLSISSNYLATIDRLGFST
ncbi:MAG: ferritin-like domain-containing protein [Gammaproteobacteria bacterium]|jgi:1,2-phenylacetyl-CoA epoxidase catalytic subunit|nr:ferritin-like domain-containing protein [Gammaproteobacteria bacterium]MBT3868645.1 ferritin-like domain-containing protein [Gammaproteobacteria bacterium]MBT4378693.1 ferritin-like domain-containing protein [Gammaproteobacteria bacterium]MBT4615308.1 ferritin-like domain-containing protein [Gammaproteobacteria bacterium]MBT5195976.1 ferritin-like domain-containing protein [Gammaproteobacteria bacterium]